MVYGTVASSRQNFAFRLPDPKDPPPMVAHPVALPFARIPVGACPVEQSEGVAARADAAPAVKLAPVPVIFVPTNALGVPKAGVTKVGEVAKTTEPLPVVAVTLSAPVPPEVVTIPLLVRFERVVIFCEAFTAIVPLVVIVPPLRPVPAVILVTVPDPPPPHEPPTDVILPEASDCKQPAP